ALPIGFSHDPAPERSIAALTQRTKGRSVEGALVDASDDPQVARVLLDVAVKKRRLRGAVHDVVGVPGKPLSALKSIELPNARPLGGEQTNSSYLYGDVLVGKLLRVVEHGESVELEILRRLADRA